MIKHTKVKMTKDTPKQLKITDLSISTLFTSPRLNLKTHAEGASNPLIFYIIYAGHSFRWGLNMSLFGANSLEQALL